MSLKIVVQGVGEVALSLERRRQLTEHRIGDAIKAGATIARDAARRLAHVPFTVRGGYITRNVQDATRRYNIRKRDDIVEARINSGRTEAQVLAKAHVTAARTKAVQGVLAGLGKTDRYLLRNSLWIKRRKKGETRSHRGHTDRSGLSNLAFSTRAQFGGRRAKGARNPIVAWARPKDLHKRDTMWLAGDALNIIVLRPAIRRNEKKILASLQLAVKKGMS